MSEHENGAGTLLPISSITPELLNAVCTEITQRDAEVIETGEPPEWWPAMVEVFKEAANTGDLGNSLHLSLIEHINKHGSTQAGGIAMKLMIMGWRMAEMHLQQSLEKSARV